MIGKQIQDLLLFIKDLVNMSDYGDDYYQYQEQQQEQEQNIQTTLQFQNCQAEQLLRQKKYADALTAFNDLYEKANQNGVKSWKAKALHQILQMHVHLGNGVEARKTLHTIRQMNEVDKTNQQSVKGIIKTLNSVERGVYQSFWQDIFALISGLDDPHSQLKCFFLMLEKQMQLGNKQKSKELYERARSLIPKINNLPLASQFQMSYLEVKYLKLQKMDFSEKLKQLYIKLPQFEQDTNVNETYISKIKEYIAPTLYSQQNYAECANFLCSFYIQNSKYGTINQKNKQLLKINLLMVLLTGDLGLLQDNQFNPMLQQSVVTYKLESDIQALYSLTQAFKNQDINLFEELLKIVKLNIPKDSPYIDLQNKVLLQLKKLKIVSICRSYKNIKFAYIQRRINENNPKIIKNLLFSLITSNKIHGVIHLQDNYLEILPEENTFYTTQLENLRDLTERM